MLRKDLEKVSETVSLLTRIMEKLFPEAEVREEVYSILNSYGGASWQPESARVKLAILKLSNGNPDQIRYFTVQACRDYRDILASAETPKQLANPFIRKNDPEGYSQLGEEDKKEYQDWIRGILGEEGKN